MFVRSALFACAAMIASAGAPALAQTPDAARCEATTFRVYFQHGSAVLDEMALQTLAAAERNVAGCGYAELVVTVDSAARGQAIQAAADARAWDAVRIAPRASMQRAAYGAAPDYAEVTLSPNVMPVGAPMTGEAGV